MKDSGYKKYPNTVGGRVRYVREGLLNLSIYEFAKCIGYSHPAVMAWERGINIPHIPAIISMKERFNINPNWLILGVGHIFFEDDFDMRRTCDDGR